MNQSPVKVNLDYLQKQQAMISTAVDNAAGGLKEMREPRQDAAAKQKLNRSITGTKSETREKSKHILVPVHRIKFVKTADPKKFELEQRACKDISVCENSKHNNSLVNTNFTHDDVQCVAKPQQSQAIKISPFAGSLENLCAPLAKPVEKLAQLQANKAVKMLINPSNTSSRFSAVSAQENTPLKSNSQTLKLFKVQLSGKSALMQPTPTVPASNRNFVKLDIQNLNFAEQPKSSTLFKRVSKPSGKPLTRRNSSVVTNLVTRLEKQGYTGSSNDDLVLVKRPVVDVLSQNSEENLRKVSVIMQA